MTEASKFWNECFGKGVLEAYDYTGRLIKKQAYNQQGSAYGWVIEYILPIDMGGKKTWDNVWIVSYETHTLRNGRLTYVIDGDRYQVEKNNCGNYEIFKTGGKNMDFWIKEFGNVEEAEDFTGRKIKKCAHGQTGSRYGWDIDHILPLSRGGKDNDENKQIVHVKTNDEKADLTTFKIDGILYQVKKTSKSDEHCWANYDYSDKKYCIEEI